MSSIDKMIRQQVTIQNKLGLHTRAAAKLVDIAKQFQSRIELVYRDRVVDCKSIMGVITLGAQKDNVLDVVITGEDEKEALEAILKLINDKFGEE
ncbi:HPr family phosphocarrier protein [Aquicella lusitana]|uniref:Phosphocarrier protein n=2 Tax=Aquicella lusitana TaxID=254246 RepID=A0A370GYP4_9COXI|nr:HPr family phosphocarrier protein [Aquicella lusitana]RDI48778.1 phosphocarrier protein [Aquicella lusitana]